MMQRYKYWVLAFIILAIFVWTAAYYSGLQQAP